MENGLIIIFFMRLQRAFYEIRHVLTALPMWAMFI